MEKSAYSFSESCFNIDKNKILFFVEENNNVVFLKIPGVVTVVHKYDVETSKNLPNSLNSSQLNPANSSN